MQAVTLAESTLVKLLGDAKKTFLWDDDDASNINHNWSE
jgi:hypothetical protein